MIDKDIWEKKPPRLTYADGTLYYFASAMDAYFEKLKAQWDLIIEENRQLREAVEMSTEDIRDRMYSGWYKAETQKGGTLYNLEMDRRTLGKVKELQENWAKAAKGYEDTIADSEGDQGIIDAAQTYGSFAYELGKVLGVKK